MLGYVSGEYLQLMDEMLAKSKQRSYTLMQVQAGQKVLDVGCGNGVDTLRLAELVGENGLVYGVDWDEKMIAEADQRASQAGLSARVHHRRADANALPFDDNTFDACRSERLFQHLSEPSGALAEMVRVTRSGGWIVVTDTDWGSMSTDTYEVDIERRLARVKAEKVLYNGYAGRQLYRLFRQQNLADITIEPAAQYTTNYPAARYIAQMDEVERCAIETGLVTQAEVARWRASCEQADKQGFFFASVTMFTIAGRKR